MRNQIMSHRDIEQKIVALKRQDHKNTRKTCSMKKSLI